jgi:signal transduction histidine kinase
MLDGSVESQGRGERSERETGPRPGDAALVAVRPEVMGEAEHAFGNLFHRLHYLAQKLQNRGVEGAAALGGSVTDLEDLLRLVLDYVSPLAIEARLLDAETVVRGLESGLERRLGERCEEVAQARVLGDGGQLSQAFAYMRRVLAEGTHVDVKVERDVGEGWLVLSGEEAGRTVVASGRAMIPWALAQKIVEAHGGTLTEETENGGARWKLRLPLAGE